jgi:hypothetical protein
MLVVDGGKQRSPRMVADIADGNCHNRRRWLMGARAFDGPLMDLMTLGQTPVAEDD